MLLFSYRNVYKMLFFWIYMNMYQNVLLKILLL